MNALFSVVARPPPTPSVTPVTPARLSQGVSGRFAHSRVHAVMGPSGCGKTSLCTLLAGKLPAKYTSGTCCVYRVNRVDPGVTTSDGGSTASPRHLGPPGSPLHRQVDFGPSGDVNGVTSQPDMNGWGASQAAAEEPGQIRKLLASLVATGQEEVGVCVRL
jgi:energy-coupling factor transporter ATP-binding protein EcfA2